MIGLKAPQNMTQLVVGSFIVGMVVAKLIVIFLADYLGMRKTLLIMLPLLLLGSLLCITPQIEILLLGRTLQGIGIGGASAIGITIIKDSTPHQAYVKKMAQWAIWVEWAPPLALLLGGFVQHWLGWRYNFLIVCIVSLVLILLALISLPKKEPSSTPHPGLKATLVSLRSGFQNKQFVAYSLMYSFIVSGQIVFYTISPFYLIHTLGMPADDYGIALMPYFAALILGAASLDFLKRSFSSTQVLRLALLFGLLGALAILILSTVEVSSVLALILPMALYGLCHSILGLEVEIKVSHFFSETPVANLGLLGLNLAIISSIIAITAAHTPSATVNYLGLFLLALVLLSFTATLFLDTDALKTEGLSEKHTV